MINLLKKLKTTERAPEELDKEILIKISNNQKIIECTKIPEFTNWNKNRPPDVTRINELKEYYISEKVKFIPVF